MMLWCSQSGRPRLGSWTNGRRLRRGVLSKREVGRIARCLACSLWHELKASGCRCWHLRNPFHAGRIFPLTRAATLSCGSECQTEMRSSNLCLIYLSGNAWPPPLQLVTWNDPCPLTCLLRWQPPTKETLAWQPITDWCRPWEIRWRGC